MLGWRMTVTKTDGTEAEYHIGPTIITAFERQFKTGLPKAFANDQKLEHLFWLAWDSERRSGTTVPPFGDDYLDTLQDVQIEPITNPSRGTQSLS